ncbi:MAG: hypothetical protein FJ144_06835 [Deltaproteobacteria bacterium]|nr:hypothetical protein [Deltaproteobacteria bacterium]
MAVALDTLEYARRLRDCGFSEQQAEGQARALAAAMTDALATKDDLKALELTFTNRFAAIDLRFAEIEARLGALEKHVDTRFEELEKRLEIRFVQQEIHFDGKLDQLEHRMTVRLAGIMVTGIGAVATLVTLF